MGTWSLRACGYRHGHTHTAYMVVYLLVWLPATLVPKGQTTCPSFSRCLDESMRGRPGAHDPAGRGLPISDILIGKHTTQSSMSVGTYVVRNLFHAQSKLCRNVYLSVYPSVYVSFYPPIYNMYVYVYFVCVCENIKYSYRCMHIYICIMYW